MKLVLNECAEHAECSSAFWAICEGGDGLCDACYSLEPIVQALNQAIVEMVSDIGPGATHKGNLVTTVLAQ